MEPAGRARVERRLAAILAADVGGLFAPDRGRTRKARSPALKALRRELIDPKIKRPSRSHRQDDRRRPPGRVRQRRRRVALRRRGAGGNGREQCRVPPDRRIEFRIGINLGDIIVDGRRYLSATASMSRPGSKAWPSRAGSASAARCATRCATSSPLRSRIMGEQQLKNIARPVRVYRVLLDERPSPLEPAIGEIAKPPLSLPDKPSIAVLPFQNMSGDPEQEYFADGMVEEIITALSRIQWLFVIARNSSFTYKGQARCEAGRARAGCPLRPRRLGAQSGAAGAHHRAVDRGRQPARISGPTASTARSKTFSSFRTRWRRASPASSSRHCKLPRSADRPIARLAI